MLTLQSLHRKTYSLELEVPRKIWGKKTIRIKFQQGTLRQILRMAQYASQNDIATWLREFLVHAGIKECYLRRLVGESYNKIFSYILRTFAKGFCEDKKKKGQGAGQMVPIYSGIVTIYQETAIDMEAMLDMTWEQIEFVIKGLQWNARSMTKKGQQQNRMELEMEKFEHEISDEEALKIARNTEEFFKKKNAGK